MMFGLSLRAFTELHTVISIVAIVAGLIFFVALAAGRWQGWANAVFLMFTVLTSVTGFLFPPKPIGPPFIFGVVSLLLLAAALYALYGGRLGGRWRAVDLVTALLAQYLNMIVLVVQTYQKIPVFHALAPTGTEPAFLATQLLALAIVLILGWRTVRGRPAAGNAYAPARPIR